METLILPIVLIIYVFSFYYCYKIAKKHNLNKVVAVFAGFLWIFGAALYSHLDYKFNKEKKKDNK